MELTPKQQLILEFIQASIENDHRPPSLREIGREFDLSVGTVQDQVEALRRKGFLTKDDTKARGLRLPMRIQQIPILGRVHAGSLHAAIEDVEGYIPVGNTLTPSQHFALRVRGDSMIDAGILEGDTVIVRIQVNADPNDIVVARMDDEATIKYLRRNNLELYLEPANPRYNIIKGPFSILGVVVEVRRQYKK